MPRWLHLPLWLPNCTPLDQLTMYNMQSWGLT